MSSTRWVYIMLGLAALAVVATGIVVVTVVGLDLMRSNRPDPAQASPTPEANSTGSISGLVWHDLCASGAPGNPAPSETPAGCVSTPDGSYAANGLLEAGESGISGVFVRLGSGACPAPIFL